MKQITIINKDGREQSFSLEKIQDILETLAVQNTGEIFEAENIIQKAEKYLEIFLNGPIKKITENQLFELIANICQEEGLNNLAEKLKGLDAFSIKHSSPIEIDLSKSNQEKFKKLYLPASQNPPLELNKLIEKVAFQHSAPTLGEKISTLIRQTRFLPHQNILKSPNSFDKMQIILDDSLADIFDQLKQVAINFQNLISTTIDFSKIRQKMSVVKSTQGFSAGPVSFIKIYASTFEALRQNLSSDFTPPQTFILNVHHPDILEYLIFIKNFQKNSLNKHLHFIIEITPHFLEALFKDEDFDLISPETRQTVNLLSAKNTFDLIISTILENPQLGLIKSNQEKNSHLNISGFINLSAYIQEKDPWAEILNDLEPVQKYLKNQLNSLPKQNKLPCLVKIGFTGWNDLLVSQKIVYGSIAALEQAEEFFTKIRSIIDPQIQLEIEIHSPLLSILESPRGFECLDQLATFKTNLEGQEVHQLYPSLRQHLTELGLASTEITKNIYDFNSLSELYQIPIPVKNLFKTSREISPQFHLELQRILEKSLQGNVEKKLYFENSFDLEKIKESLLSELQNGINSIRYAQFDPIGKTSEENDQEGARNFLLNLGKTKKRRHREIQPPLFQIKKTEEIPLPPIST